MDVVFKKACGYIVVVLFQISLGVFDIGSATTDTSIAALVRVDQSGSGDFKTIQAAIDSVPSNNSQLFFIYVKPGVYREKITVPANKPFITLSGLRASKTIITWNDGGDIQHSSTLTVLASDFVGRYLTIQNTYGSSGQAVALRVVGNRVAFYGFWILSYQDTLLDETGSHYYTNCYIEGATDFICGNAASLFQGCHMHTISKNNGSITAQLRSSPNDNTGYTFIHCKITGTENGTAFLGRPWGPYSRVVFAFTYISDVIVPPGWDDWGTDTSSRRTVYYGEYKCYGPGSDRSKRVIWSRSLSDSEVELFLTKDFIGGGALLRLCSYLLIFLNKFLIF